jgi:dolichol kinase
MTDLTLLAIAGVLLGGGMGVAMLLRAAGMPSTYVRDVLHIGAGVWVLGWPWWQAPAWPIAITAVVAAGTALVPLAARRMAIARRLHEAVTGGDERWSGLVLYTASYALFTAAGLLGDPLPAAAALLALSLGDGIGGAVGRRFGQLHFRAPGGKRKSLEGSLTVGLMAGAGALIAAEALGMTLPVTDACMAGTVAAGAEAAAPRGTDNLLVPVSVWLALGVLA